MGSIASSCTPRYPAAVPGTLAPSSTVSQPDAMRALPTCGWVSAPAPVTHHGELARHLGLLALDVKRDDLLTGLLGGTKTRKLDVLLASAPFRDAARLASIGAIGSGHLAACTAAAAALGKDLDAHVFFEPVTEGVLENLAFVASGPTRLVAYGNRVTLALTRPSVLLSPLVDGAAMIPPGGSVPAGIAGVARAGFELAAQIGAGELEPPDVVYCALGTGGTVAGLALGLGMAGVRTEIRAVAVVERVFVTSRTVRRHIARTAAWLRAAGVPCDAAQAVPVRIVRNQLGPGYGVATAQSLAAVEVMRMEGLPCEPIYTGKAFAALLADAARGRAPKRALFWHTLRRGPLPHAPQWRDRLPARLSRQLDRSAARARPGRRAVLVGGAAALAAVATHRLTGYRDIGWSGAVLRAWEAQVIADAAAVLSGVPGIDGLVVAANVDRFLIPLPAMMKAEIHALLGLVEHGTTPLGLRAARFTRLPPDAREAYLLSLGARGGLLAQAFRGLRDLILVGAYQQQMSWRGIGYAGPWPAIPTPELLYAPYESFRAPPGAVPKDSASAT